MKTVKNAEYAQGGDTVKKSAVIINDPREEMLYLKKRIEIAENKLDMVNGGKLTDALCYELLGLKARLGYLFDSMRR